LADNLLKIKMTLDASQFTTATQQMGDQAGQVTGEAEVKFGSLFSSVGAASLAFNNVTQAVQTVIGAVEGMIQPFMRAQSQMAEIASLGVENVDELNRGVQELGQTIPKPMEDLRGGLYQVVSAGVDANHQIEVLGSSAKAAAAGLANTTDSLNLGSAVIKGYGKEWGAFDSVMDQAFQTVKLGQTTFSELASAVGLVTPLASAMKMPMEELFGVMATGTGVTGTASEVATQLRGVLQGLAQPTKEMTALMQSHGYATAEAAAADLGLSGVLEILRDATGGSAAAMGKFFGSVEATTLALALSGPQYDTLLTKTEAMRNSTGAMSEAFGKTTDTLESQIQLLQNRWTVVLERAATAVVPLVSGLLGLITGSLDTRSEMTKLGEQVDAVSRGMAEVKNVDQLADRYAVLTGKAELTKDEQRELTTVTQQLAAAYPGAVTALDEFGKAAAVNVGHVRLLADQQRALFSAQNADLQKKTNKELTDYLSVLDEIGRASCRERV
jgi:TP901 family phage tail tape measure protein